MRKLLFVILTATALSLPAGKPLTVATVKAMSCFNLQTELTDNEKVMLTKAQHSVPGTLDVLIRIHEKRLPGLQAEDEVVDHLVTRTYTQPLNEVFEERDRLLDKRRQTLAKVKRCQDTIAALQETLATGKPPEKDPPPTVESVKAMSCFDLETSLTDTEGMMLENARHSVPDTLSALIRIHTKRMHYLETDAGYEAFSKEYMRGVSTYAPTSDIIQAITDKPGAYRSRVAKIQRTIENMKALLEKLESKKKS